MMTTILAFAILCATTLLVLGSLRMVAQDTFTALSTAASRMHRDGKPLRKLAFAALWILIFLLSFLL